MSAQKLLNWWHELPKIWQLFLYHHQKDYTFVVEDLDKYDKEFAEITPQVLQEIANVARLPVVFEEGTLLLQDIDLTPLTRLKNLADLLLMNTQLRDLSPIADMKRLRTLILSGPDEWAWNPEPPYFPFEFNRGNLQALEKHPHLSFFHIYGNPGFLDIDLDLISQLPQLRALTLANTELSKIVSLKPLANAKHLSYLDISNTSVDTLEDIWQLSSLRTLFVSKRFNRLELHNYRQTHRRCVVKYSVY